MTFFRKNRKQYIKLCIFFLLFQVTYTMLISICGIRQGNIREMLSVPIQQTSRYVTQYQVTEDEQKIIENVKQLEEKSDFECSKMRADKLMENGKYLNGINEYK